MNLSTILRLIGFNEKKIQNHFIWRQNTFSFLLCAVCKFGRSFAPHFEINWNERKKEIVSFLHNFVYMKSAIRMESMHVC